MPRQLPVTRLRSMHSTEAHACSCCFVDMSDSRTDAATRGTTMSSTSVSCIHGCYKLAAVVECHGGDQFSPQYRLQVEKFRIFWSDFQRLHGTITGGD